jgi:hypothetical protein
VDIQWSGGKQIFKYVGDKPFLVIDNNKMKHAAEFIHMMMKSVEVNN